MVKRTLSIAWKTLKRAAGNFFTGDAIVFAAAVAFYSSLSLAPLLLMLLWGASLLGAGAVDALLDQVRDLLGPQAGEVIRTVVESANRHPSLGNLAGIIAAGTILFSSTTVFAQLQESMNRVWGVRGDPKRGVRNWLRARLLSFGVILALGFLLVVSLAVSAAVAFLANLILPGTEFLWQVVSFLFSVAIFTLFFAALFRYLPDVRIAWRDVRPGALLTAILFSVGKVLIGLYLGKSVVASSYGAAGSLVVMLLWVYYSAIIVFFGAECTEALATVRGRSIRPARHAVPVRGREI